MSTGKRFEPIRQPCSFFSASRSSARIGSFSFNGIMPTIVAVPPRRSSASASSPAAIRPTASIA
jgi:hypothetical protein